MRWTYFPPRRVCTSPHLNARDVVDNQRKAVELDPLKSRTFAHGVTKKTKKDLEREEEERKRAEEEAFVPVHT